MPRSLSLGATALLLLSTVAFWPGYLAQVSRADAYTHAHAVLGTLWLLFLIVQPQLLRGASRRRWHRYLGRAGVALGALFAVTGLLASHRSVTRLSDEQFAIEGWFVYLPLAMAIIFALALYLAVYYRRSAPIHGRFMVATALPLLDPVFGRLLFRFGPPLPREFLYQVPAFSMTILLLVVLWRSAPRQAHGRKALAVFGVAVTTMLLGYFVVPQTETWHHFAAWFRSLAITG